MTLNAFKDGVTMLNQTNLNTLLNEQPFKLIYTGTQRDIKYVAAGTTNYLNTQSYCTRFTLTSATDIGRITLNLDKFGDGADVVVEIRSGMVPASGNDGTLLKQVTLPKEFVSTTAGWISIPINLTGLTSGAQYWILVRKAGDSTDRCAWMGESSQDASYPSYYRAADSGNWSVNNALCFSVYSNNPAEGSDSIYHAIIGTNLVCTYSYDGNGLITKVTKYLPPSDGSSGGVRDVLNFTMSGDYISEAT